ncbi:MAG: hypothetical protein WBP29_11220 [Candidatus Zixiibacteriota bacterium]
MNFRIRSLLIVISLLISIQTAFANRIIAVSPDTAVAQPNVTFVKDFSFSLTDFETPLKWSVRAIGDAPAGKFEVPDYFSGRFIFTPSIADSGHTFKFEITVGDNRNLTVSAEFMVRVGKRAPAVIEIELAHGSVQGMWENVSVSKSGGELTASSFKIRLCYNGAGLKFDTLTFSAKLIERGWTYKLSNVRTLTLAPLGLEAASIEVIAYCSTKQIVPLQNGELFNLKFYVTNDRDFDCQFIPMYFVWSDCSDNAFTSDKSDTIFTSLQVVDCDWSVNAASYPGADCSQRYPVSLSGPCPNGCTRNRGMVDSPNIVFKNGGVDIMCNGNIVAPGDLTLNDIPYEVADFNLMARWLAYGDSVLDINPQFRQAQIEMSDANQDGTTGSVADMVYLVRVIVGDALPFPKLMPYQQSALIEKLNDTIYIESNDSLAGVLILSKAGDETGFENLSNLEMVVGRRGSLTTLLFKPSLANLQGHVPAGRTPLVRVKGKCELRDAELSDYNGNIMNVRK